jgi:hypothetical protein
MDETQFWLVTIIGPAILIILLLWLVIKTRSRRGSPQNDVAERGTRDLYADEELRRRDGTDDL